MFVTWCRGVVFDVMTVTIQRFFLPCCFSATFCESCADTRTRRCCPNTRRDNCQIGAIKLRTDSPNRPRPRRYYFIVSMRHTDVEGWIMKILSALTLILLAGCTIGPTMEELETQAFLTGDWTQVEKRERAIARREERAGPQCPRGLVALCVDRVFERACSCQKREDLSIAFSR
jgi:hypothetical protein